MIKFNKLYIMTSKQLNIILGIIIVILLGVGGYMALKYNTQDRQTSVQPDNTTSSNSPSEVTINSPSNSEAAPVLPDDWKVYINSKYKFSVGYPKNWVVIDSSSGALSVSRTEACKTDNFQTLEQFMDQYRDCERFTVWAGDTSAANFTDIQDDNYFKVNIGGEPGQKFIYNLAMQGSVDGQAYYIPRATIDAQVYKNGVWYKFSMVLHQQNINRAIQEFDSFLASFQFLN